MTDIHRHKLLWVYCPGHADLKGNDRADRLVGKATVINGLSLGRSSVEKLESQPAGTKPRTSHHRSPGGERRKEKRARRCSLKRRERAIVSQTNTGTVSKATLGKLLRQVGDGGWGRGGIWIFQSSSIPS